MKNVKEVYVFTDEYSVFVHYGSYKQANEFARLYQIKQGCDEIHELPEHCEGACLQTSKTMPIIWLEPKRKDKNFMSVLAHEACHAMDDIIETTGIEDESGEFRAYGVGAIVRAFE